MARNNIPGQSRDVMFYDARESLVYFLEAEGHFVAHVL